MFNSIRNRLLGAIMLINSLILIGIIFFAMNFENFYIRHTAKDLHKVSNEISTYLKEGLNDKNSEKILEIARKENINLDLYNSNGVLLITSKTNSSMGMGMGMMKGNRYTIVGEYQNLDAYIMKDKSENIEFLATDINDDTNSYRILCKTPISAIKNSVSIALRFLLIIFLPITLISMVLAMWYANKFTRPIIHLNKVTDKISNLNFEEKVEINTNDEIGKLGESVNKLSEEINSALTNLKDKNYQLQILIENQIKEDKLKREFVSSVSHELKTPITVISGYAEGLRSKVITGEEDKQYYIDVIYEESEKMGIMVKDLLDLYKLESKSFSIKKEEISIVRLIEDSIKNFENKIIKNSIDLKLDIDEIYITGDKIRLGQVINNFIDNALHHIDNDKKLEITAKSIDGKARVGVYNSGKNIDEKDREKIWYSFSRLDEARSTSDNRVGLGLAIVREIVKLHNGEYGYINKENGVEFYFEI